VLFFATKRDRGKEEKREDERAEKNSPLGEKGTREPETQASAGRSAAKRGKKKKKRPPGRGSARGRHADSGKRKKGSLAGVTGRKAFPDGAKGKAASLLHGLQEQKKKRGRAVAGSFKRGEGEATARGVGERRKKEKRRLG